MKSSMGNKPALLPVCLLLLCSCASHTPMQFYMLNAQATVGSVRPAAEFPRDLVVGLGPVHLPEYLHRPQIVSEIRENEFNLDEHHRWAERLDENITRTLATQLADRLGLTHIIRYPWSHRQIIDYQISVDILALHHTADGYSRLQVQWQITQQDQTLLSKRFACNLVGGDNVNDFVSNESMCLGNLGMEIEENLRMLVRNKIL